MMKNNTTAQASLDMDIDSYMASAPSKNYCWTRVDVQAS
jgi:hypothetical protein